MLIPLYIFFTFKIPVNCLQILPGSLNPLLQLTLPYSLSHFCEGNTEEENNQRVTKICRLSFLANSALVYESKCGV
jgi:hypothetical protein